MEHVDPDSKRIRAFRSGLIKVIPRFPNNRDTLNLLEQKPLTGLIVVYLNWQSRFIRPRRRKVIVEGTLTNDIRWLRLRHDTQLLLELARHGSDLTPYLSLKVHSEGFAPTVESSSNPRGNTWQDKDFLLNVMGYHHLHLNHVKAGKHHNGRTDDVLFAEVTRDYFIAIGYFNHSVFDAHKSAEATMQVERARLWNIFDERSSRGIPPNTAYCPTNIAVSGHNARHVMMAIECGNIISKVDSNLNDIQFRMEHFGISDYNVAKKMKLNWVFNGLDFGVYDRTTNRFMIYLKGAV